MNENQTQEVINQVKKLLENTKDFSYRNLGSISAHVNVPKSDLLKILVNNPDFEIVFNEENYNPNSGPLLALSKVIKQKEKESGAIIQKEIEKERAEKKARKEKEKEKKKTKKKTSSKKKPRKPSAQANKKRVKEATKALIKCHLGFNTVLKKYSLSLYRNDPKYMNMLTSSIHDIAGIISEIIENNDFSQEDLLDKK